MKINTYIGIIAAITLASCSRNSGSHALSADEMESVRQHGYEDAIKAINAADSMEMEHQLLEIRAKETQLKQTGNFEAARSYVEAAEKTLRDSSLIK